MLKPDPMRYTRAVPTRISGPEWIEPDPAENERAESPQGLAFHHVEELTADLALDLQLHEILEQALQATAATGAVIALASGDEMVCRATWGKKAPSTGAFVNTRSGLSGLCIQTREMQRCDDAVADPRVNADACRFLDIRSIVVLPILEGTRFWGILEVFSSSPYAFSDAEVQALQVLDHRVSRAVQEAVEGESLTPGDDSWPVQTRPGPEHPKTIGREILTPRRRDYRTGALTVAVIALAVLLGWMVGRVGWSMAGNRSPAQLSVSPEDAQAAVHVAPQTVPSAVVEEPANSAKPGNPAPAAPLASKTASRPKAEAAEPTDGLVVYEQGKVVFRMTASSKASPAGSDSGPLQNAVNREGEEPLAVSPSATDSYLLQRVDPEYPEEAKQQHVQGPVVLNALVGTGGAVRELKVIRGDPLLVKAATDAVRQWRFQPHRLQGRLVEFETQITVNFTLP